MHVPDGFLDAPTSLATGAAAVGAIALSLRRAERETAAAGPALAGLSAAFVFSVQMVNFPVGAGTSGHVLGAALAAALVGPWTAILVMSAVLLVQGLLFADGGLTAVGTNVMLMGVVAVTVATLVTRGALTVLPRRPRSVVPAAAAGAAISVPAAAGVFALLYAVGGAVPVPVGALTAAMVGWHALIGAGEALVTAVVLGAVVAARPDLVHAARHLRPPVVLVDAAGRPIAAALPAAAPAPAVPDRRTARRRARLPIGVGLAAALVVAGGLSLLASTHPDGLELVASTLGFSGAARASAVAAGPLADYGLAGVPGPLGAGLAGVAGVLVTVLVGTALARAARRHAEAAAEPDVAGR